MVPPMRILLVTARYYPHRGGLETVVYHLAREFRELGHEVKIVTNRYPRTLSAREVVDDIEVERIQFLYPELRFLREGRLDLLAASFWFVPVSLWNLWRAIQKFKPDVINLHYLWAPGFFLRILRSLIRFPWVVSLHGGDVDAHPNMTRQGRRLLGRVTQQADAVTACSRHLARLVADLFPAVEEKLKVIHNGVDWRLFAAASSYPHSKSYIAAVGQLVPHKGFDLLIGAFGEIASDYPEVDILIAGEGASRRSLEALVDKVNLTGRVHFLGMVCEQTVASIMAGSLFLAVPSKREIFGLVALEGMASGRLVLTTPVGGIPEFLPNCNSMVKAEHGAWTAALAEMVSRTRLGAFDIEHNRNVAERFGWIYVAQAYLDCYLEAIG
jgi:glycosyltransferase involved in cell wall biosynthesis